MPLVDASATTSKKRPCAALCAPLDIKTSKQRRAAVGAKQRRSSKYARNTTKLAAGNRPRCGKAKESLEQHQAKHRTREARQMCLRCQYHDNALRRQYPWSAERRTGLWAIGCVPCATLLRTSKKDGSVRFSKYARYQGLSDIQARRSNSAAHCFRVHESQDVHKLAISKFPSFSKFSPTLRCVSLKQACPSRSSENCTTKTTAGFNPKSAVGDLTAELVVDDVAADLARSDRKLLKGSVPQLQDWADTWEAVTENQSIRKQQRSQKKRGNVVRSRQCIRKQRRILADDSREKHRKRLREATSITLALDEGKYKKVVRFRCDTPAPVADGKPAVAKGILGIVDCSHENTAEFEEDHAVIAVKKLDGLITKFCSARGPGGQPLAPDLIEQRVHMVFRCEPCLRL